MCGLEVLETRMNSALEIEAPRSGLLRRRKRNRRVAIQKVSLGTAMANALSKASRATMRFARVTAKLALLMAVLVAAGWGGRIGFRHLVSSPRFQLRTVEYVPTAHLGSDDMLALAGVSVGDKLLAVDTDEVAANVARHPWAAKVRVSRQLPSTLVVEVDERRAAAVAALSGLYLIDESGRPFKRATMDEADGLPVLTGIDRARYAEIREVSEAAFREALAVLRQYREGPTRPMVGEVAIDPSFGFSLFLLEGGAEIRLGRGNYSKKLALFDQILESVVAKEIRIVHLDLPESGKIPVLLRNADAPAPAKLTLEKNSKKQTRND